MRCHSLVLSVALLIVLSVPATATTIGQIDTFQNGTTEGWVAGGGPLGAFPPVPPFNDPTGGPAGAGDAFLHIVSQGGVGPGSRLTAFNIFSQWADNYLTNGIGAIAMDLRNLGVNDLTIRLEFEDPFVGGNFAVTNTGFTLPAQSDWMHVVFTIGLNHLTAVQGNVAGALGNTSVLRIIHAPDLTGVPIAGELGVDNITALAVPEPGSASSIALGLAFLICLAWRRQSQPKPIAAK